MFCSNVKDINSVLEVTVYDEDRDHKVEFLGKVAIPLLRIRNGEKKWYSLKDKKLHVRAKGNCPQILMEMTVLWNPVSNAFMLPGVCSMQPTSLHLTVCEPYPSLLHMSYLMCLKHLVNQEKQMDVHVLASYPSSLDSTPSLCGIFG
jgi:hypothetical protein